MWQIIGASAIGKKHIDEAIPCQDSHGYRFIDNSWGLIVVSDGAGTCEQSHIGSKLVVEFCLEEFSSLIINDTEVFEKDAWEKTSQKRLYNVRNKLLIFSNKNNLPIKSLSATCIILLFSREIIYSIHIGDGRAGYKNAENEWSHIITPFNGEYANQTVFITSDIWDESNKYIEASIIEDSIVSVVALTDGAENTCWLLNKEDTIDSQKTFKDQNKPYPPFFNSNINQFKHLSEQGYSAEKINNLWNSYLQNGLERFEYEPDDKTIVVAFKNE